MKKPLLLFCFLFSFLAANAQFTSPGTGITVDLQMLLNAGAATYSGGAYHISQSLTLESPDTMIINTNEIIRLAPGLLITIKGALLINPPDSVVFTSNIGGGNFNALRFESPATGAGRVSTIRKVVIEKSSGIRVLNAAVNIDSCIVRNTDGVGQSAGINISGASPVTITNCRIFRNVRAGISSPTNGANVTIRDSWFFENGTTPGLNPQINLGPATSGGKIEITGNTIIGIQATTNRSGGIAVANLLGAPTLTNILIENNFIKYNSFGITIAGANIKGYIKKNIIENNNVNPMVLTTGSGINFNSTSTTQQVVATRNTIRNNHWGITIQSNTAVASGARPQLGRIGSADTANVGRNNIYDNIQGTNVYDLYNNTTDSIYAENNSWGTTNLADIEDHIFHKTDNANHGFVKYQPIFGTVSGITPPAENTFAVFPNPASEVVNFNLKTAGNQTATIRIFNALGQEVKAVRSSEKKIQVNTQNFAKGLYTYRIETKNEAQTGKLVIVK